MTYPGDSSLAPEIQQRILTTYQQTVELASTGNKREALLGCDFVLRLDPSFQPARTLQQMIQGGSPAEAFGVLLANASVDARAGAASGGDVGRRLAALVEERRFDEALALAEAEKRAVAAEPGLRKLVEAARSRQEAEPYLKTFLDSARIALQGGDETEADRLLAKARALDATHPGIAELEAAKAFYADPSRALSGRRPAGAAAAADEAPAADMFAGDLELPDVDFAFDAPAAPGAAAAGFDLTDEAPEGAAAESEGEGRIAELLREGQAAFDRGEHQSAIDSWSRIFLIDIDHQEAARRIELARQQKAERERETEELFHDAVARFDAGDLAAAGAGFERVLAAQPGYVLAQEYLEKIAERAAGGTAPTAPARAPGERPSGERLAERSAPRPPSGAHAALAEEILVPPEPGEMPARPAARRSAPRTGFAVSAKRKSAGASGRFALIGGAVLVVLAAAGWFVATRWERFFPNAQPVATPTPAVVDPLDRARALHAEGKTAVAIAQLRRIPPQDPHYAEAQSLVSQWEALVAEAEKPQLTAAQAALRRQLIERAESAAAANDYVRVRSRLEQARQIAPLDATAAALAATAEERMRPFGEELRLMGQGDYEYALGQLWRRREAEPGNADLDRLIVDAYYDLGVLDLQRGDPGAAIERLREARKLDPNDPELVRLERFAATYRERGEDLMYRIFVKYLPLR